MVSLLLAQSIFLGIFIGAFDITAHSLFLSTFDEKMMARAYICSGIVGTMLTWLFGRLKSRMKIKSISALTLIIVTFLTIVLWITLTASKEKWLIFTGFVMFGPLNLLVLLGYRAMTEKLFNGEQNTRILQFTDAGLIAGTVIISFLIPLLILFRFNVTNVFLLSACSVLIAAIIQISGDKKMNKIDSETENYPDKSDNSRSSFAALRKNHYTRSIGLFIVLSVIAAFFIQYSFMAVTREQFPFAEKMAEFLGVFTGCVMILILILKYYVFTHLLRNFGLKTCLIITPFLIAIISSLAILAGGLMGYNPAYAGGFILFFLLLSAGRVISKSLKYTVQQPSLKILFQSIEVGLRAGINRETTTLLNEVLVVISGLILTCLGFLTFIRLIHFYIVLLIIVLVWLYAAFILFKKYKESVIRSTLKGGLMIPKTDNSVGQSHLKKTFSVNVAFSKDYFSLIAGDFSALNTDNIRYYDHLIQYAVSKNDYSLIPALKKIAGNTKIDEIVRRRAVEASRMLSEHLVSPKPENDRNVEAARALSGTRKPQTTEILRLLRESSPESKRLAIYMIGKFGLTDLLSEVCGCLSIPQLANDAAEVLKTFGSESENELVRYYLVNSGNIKLSKKVLQLIGSTCTKETKDFLFSRLWSNSRILKEVVVKCLINCNFRPSDEEKLRLSLLTSDIIGIITWYLSAKISFEKENDTFLIRTINAEIERWHKFLFNILSVTYNSGTVERITEDLGKGSLESVIYALEMINVIVCDPVKLKLIYLLDVVPDEVKIKNLFQFFPGEIPGHKKLMEEIINRDYNLISLWTKACTLRSITSIEGDDMAESVTALLFSPEELIQEESALLIARSDPQVYHSASERLPELIRNRLDNIINGQTAKEEFLFERMRFLSETFGIPEDDELLSLASGLKYSNTIETEFISITGGTLVWFSSDKTVIPLVHVIYNTDGIIPAFENLSGMYNSFYYLPLIDVEQYHYQFPDKSSEILKYIDASEN